MNSGDCALSGEFPVFSDPRQRRRPLVQADMERMNIPKLLWKVDFDGVQEGPHKDVLGRYLEKLPEMVRRGFGLLLWGNNGVGKTGAAVVVAKEARRLAHSVLFVRAADLRTFAFSNRQFDGQESWLDRARSVDLLVLDDLGKEGKDVKAESERLFEDVLRYRVGEQKSTILTTNLAESEFIEPDHGGYHESFLAVMKGMVLPVQCVGKDYRNLLADELQLKLAK